MEVSEEPKTGEELKNYTYTTDLWQRVIHLHHVCRAYINSSFVQSMDGQFVRPPIIRTNAILKNKNLRQCLELWEFIEGYENLGYNMLIQENLETLDPRYIKEIYSISALQYLIFRYNIKNEFEAEKNLASDITPGVLSPEIKNELDPFSVSEFHKTFEKTIRVTEDGGKKGRDAISLPLAYRRDPFVLAGRSLRHSPAVPDGTRDGVCQRRVPRALLRAGDAGSGQSGGRPPRHQHLGKRNERPGSRARGEGAWDGGRRAHGRERRRAPIGVRRMHSRPREGDL
jgi:hypothetical protein